MPAPTTLLATVDVQQILKNLRAARGLHTFRVPVASDYQSEQTFTVSAAGTNTVTLARTQPVGSANFLVLACRSPVNFTLTGTGLSYSGRIESFLMLTQPGMGTLTLTGLGVDAEVFLIYAGLNN